MLTRVGTLHCMSSMVSMKEIAEQLKLSRSTVSYALTNRWQAKRVHPSTRQKVLSKAHELGYRRNHAALTLKSRVTKTIGILVPTISSESIHQMLTGIEQSLGDQYTFLFGVSNWDTAKEAKIMDNFAGRRVDGMIAVTSGRTEIVPMLVRLHKAGLPIIQVEHSHTELKTDVVECDNVALASVLTGHLIELEHRQIVFLRSPRVHSGTLERATGYECMMRKHRLQPRLLPEVPVYSEASRFEFYRSQVRSFMRDTKPPFALVTNDLAGALGALQEIESAGYRCPKDVSICTTSSAAETSTNESTFVNNFLRIRFTSAQWSVEAMGRRAAELLLQRMQQSGPSVSSGQRILIPVQLVPGNSTASPRESTTGNTQENQQQGE